MFSLKSTDEYIFSILSIWCLVVISKFVDIIEVITEVDFFPDKLGQTQFD
jgi:hypothetical protein